MRKGTDNMSNHIGAPKGAIAESILLPGDPLRAKFIAENFLQNAKQYNEIRGMLGYTGTYKGVPVSVQGTGMGMPSIGIYSWELMTEYGCQNLVRIGTAGGFSEDVKIRDIVVAMGTTTDSNYGDTFDLPGNYAPICSYELLCKVQEAAKENNINIKVGNMYSTDVFYDLKDRRIQWQRMGVMGVEMEAAALYMNAAYHRRNAICICTISDHFITGEVTTPEERQTTFTEMMTLALEAVIK